jgi:hypothetical protein
MKILFDIVTKFVVHLNKMEATWSDITGNTEEKKGGRYA